MAVRPALLGGLKVALNPVDPSQTAIFRELFFDNNYDLGLIPFTPDQIFDCGDHIGMFSLLARQNPVADIIIFEPNPNNMEWIRRQAQLNGLNIEVVQAAVSVREGKSRFRIASTALGIWSINRHPACQNLKIGNRKFSASPGVATPCESF